MLRFGTDGVRGVAGAELTAELVMALGRVAARRLAAPGAPVFVIGRDTRLSGPLLAAALAAGVASEGLEVIDAGVVPTPAVAAMCVDRGAPGAVISASHNSFADNGIKLFGPGGRKLDDDAEAAIESDLRRLVVAGDESGRGGGGGGDVGGHPVAGTDPRSGTEPRSGTGLGVVRTNPDAGAWYRRRLGAALEGRGLGGLRVAIDCAHGAASGLAAATFTAAGAEVVAMLGAAPDGTNINRGCGSTDPAGLAAVVGDSGADVGLAFDGDADRVIAIDAAGSVVDGDRLLALFAADLRASGRLAGATVVVTVMTNLGFHVAMADAGIAVHQTQVGDRHVLAALDAHGWSLGGEQSGHVIFRDLATTGDGLLSGLLLLDLLVRSGRTLADLAGHSMVSYPQVLRNVEVADRDGLEGATGVWEAVKRAEADLGSQGRVLLRPSGTERVVRVMVEAATQPDAEAVASRLAAAVAEALGGPLDPAAG